MTGPRERILVLVRHGQSEWNLTNRFTGRSDVDLTPLGREEAARAGHRLAAAGLTFDRAVTTPLRRASRTCRILLDALGRPDLVPSEEEDLDERDYGDITGMDKDEARRRFGEDQVETWRRSYDVRPPGGESLQDTVARVLPCFMQRILPPVMRGERTLVAAHGNSLRALMMVLDRMTRESIVDLELPTGEPVVYRFGPDTCILAREMLAP